MLQTARIKTRPKNGSPTSEQINKEQIEKWSSFETPAVSVSELVMFSFSLLIMHGSISFQSAKFTFHTTRNVHEIKQCLSVFPIDSSNAKMSFQFL